MATRRRNHLDECDRRTRPRDHRDGRARLQLAIALDKLRAADERQRIRHIRGVEENREYPHEKADDV
ncbi:MAG: hypothetical protein WKH64_07925 [Chloroflexia bacterium]